MAGFGMEILFRATQSQISSREDALVCAVHFNLIRNGFSCIGIGEDISKDVSNVKKSEMLPEGWNANHEVYTLQYCHGNQNDVYLLKIIRLMDDTLLVNLLRAKDEMVCDLTVSVGKYTGEDLSSFDSAYKNLKELRENFQREILDKLSSPEQHTQSLQSSSRQRNQTRQDEDNDPLRVPTRGPPRQNPPEWGESSDPFAVGRGDLDPLAGGRGGGMLMDPFRSGGFPRPDLDPHAGLPGRLPRGAVPPGARFDPFGPPDLDGSGSGNPRGGRGRRPGPDPDHLPPPGYDDMFM